MDGLPRQTSQELSILRKVRNEWRVYKLEALRQGMKMCLDTFGSRSEVPNETLGMTLRKSRFLHSTSCNAIIA